jgi:hypothetical protein
MEYLATHKLPTQHFLGTYQTMLTNRWEALDGDEQKEWEERGRIKYEEGRKEEISSVELSQ